MENYDFNHEYNRFNGKNMCQNCNFSPKIDIFVLNFNFQSQSNMKLSPFCIADYVFHFST